VAFANFLKRLRKTTASDSPLTDSQIGSEGESAAARYLENQGFSLLERNWSCSIGEVDLICRNGEGITFVEVKTSRKSSAWPPETRVNHDKQRRLRSLASYYIKQHHLDAPCRFDVVAVWWEEGQMKLRHIENAF
jgi:putative endonuclease